MMSIPQRLWISNRPEDPNFEPDEVLYRRIQTPLPADFRDDDTIGVELFEIKDDSYNRSKYCSTEYDVLFNTRIQDNGQHYSNWGIISVTVGEMIEPVPFNLQGKMVECQLLPEHAPGICNYAHTEAWFYRDGIKVSKNKPPSMKTFFRRRLLKTLKVIANYDENHINMPE